MFTYNTWMNTHNGRPFIEISAIKEITSSELEDLMRENLPYKVHYFYTLADAQSSWEEDCHQIEEYNLYQQEEEL